MITQDSDFGTIIYQKNIDFIGILYLKPGHFEPKVRVETLTELFKQGIEIQSLSKIKQTILKLG